ncbi:hypothetical protein PR202_ga11946 [Eleusine coracana subsp. coracana]|uniref:Disease resistance protein n=1 Tax=Eleusine coracana subsp. coracana TaxID=191504 RepID=A0AAV5CAC3_ELECO|nr:hypothetical protein PR202_ga11946 [Eleusine coracana subsp. coracana]
MQWDLLKSDEVLPAHGFGQLSSSTLPFLARIRCNCLSPKHWDAVKHLAATLEILELRSYERGLRTLPAINPCFPCLRSLDLGFPDLEILPEWLWHLNHLEDLRISGCSNLTSLPYGIQNLTALKKLMIVGCPRLSQKCANEDAHKISHIPNVMLQYIWVRGQPIDRPEGT